MPDCLMHIQMVMLLVFIAVVMGPYLYLSKRPRNVQESVPKRSRLITLGKATWSHLAEAGKYREVVFMQIFSSARIVKST
jgi:hypothetical protein